MNCIISCDEMKTSVKTAAEAVVAAGVTYAASRNPQLRDVEAGIAGPGTVTLLACAPSVAYAREKYYGLKAALRH
jgi:hypothetical protein